MTPSSQRSTSTSSSAAGFLPDAATAAATAAAAAASAAAHIPYRNSKLTHLLAPCLRGDGKTLMLVSVTPAPESAGGGDKSPAPP
jgi:hypothetical protein